MVNGFKVITLCGSTRFKDEFLEAQKRLPRPLTLSVEKH